MTTEIRIPKLGLTMTEGTIDRWLVTPGTQVAAGTPLFELSTDKLVVEVEAEAPGVLDLTAPAGVTAPCGEVVGYLRPVGEPLLGISSQWIEVGDPGAKSGAAVSPGNRSSSGTGDRLSSSGTDVQGAALGLHGRLLASPHARRLAGQLGVDLTTVAGTGPGGRVVGADVIAVAAAVPDTVAGQVAPEPRSGGAVAVSPAGQALAEKLGLPLSGMTGRGPGGRITVDDVIAMAHAPLTDDAPQARPLSAKRRLIGERMHSSLQEMAQLTVTRQVETTALVSFREQLREQWGGHDLSVPTYTDLVVKAAALALRHHPEVNASLVAGTLQLHRRVHVGVAVDIDDGLIVPVVHDADRLGLDLLATETARLVEGARSGSLLMSDIEGATFTISNLGGLGVDFFTPIVNPPNVAILGVGRLRAEWRGGAEPVQVMGLSLSFDHRVLDGAPAARFLQTVSRHLEAPLVLLRTP